jgi:NarL family two-component system response regulator LiaR
MVQDRIRVLVVDDHLIVREGIKALLTEFEDMEVVGEAGGGEEAVRLAKELRPDVILMDLVMPEVDGIEAILRICALQLGTRILALTSFSADDKVFPAIKAGALGYILKDTDPHDLVRAVRQTFRGESFLHPRIARKVLQELTQSAKHQPLQETLTERETEVLAHVARGLTNQEIADALFVSEPTVRSHVSNILNKLRLQNRVQATLYALREGLATLKEPALAGPKLSREA